MFAGDDDYYRSRGEGEGGAEISICCCYSYHNVLQTLTIKKLNLKQIAKASQLLLLWILATFFISVQGSNVHD